MDCARSGVNAITTGEEAFYPWNSSHRTTQLLDDLARKNGCTLCGSGYQDVFWGNLVTTLAGATHTIQKIIGKFSYNVEDYGIVVGEGSRGRCRLRTSKRRSLPRTESPLRNEEP
jgi:4-hydroxy-tetrahydrodipicolinate reductase